jgi:hypothetical protein
MTMIYEARMNWSSDTEVVSETKATHAWFNLNLHSLVTSTATYDVDRPSRPI